MKTLALLIDGDNAQLSTIHQIIQFCQSYGTLEIKKAYGDWKKPPLSSQSQKITELGINLVQQSRVTPNATDFRLAMDVAVMLEKSEVDIYILVSSDNHFTVACEQIRQNGAQVIGIGSKNSISSKLRKACNEFYNIEKIVEDQNQSPVNSSTTTQPKHESKIKPAPKSKTTNLPKSKPASKPKPKISTVPETQDNPPTAVPATIIKTPAMFKLLSKAPTKAAAVSKPKAESQPKVEAKPKTVVKPKVEVKPEVAPKPKAEAQSKVAPKPKAVVKPKVATKPKVVPKPESKAKIKAVATPKAEPNSETMLEILIDVYQKASPKGGWVNTAQLGDVRPQLKQKFGAGFAKKPISTWFKSFPDKFEVDSDRVRMK